MYRQKFLLIILIAVLMALYFFGHNSGSSRENLLAGFRMIARIAGDLGAVALLASIGGGIGRRSLGRFDFSVISKLEQIAIESMIGLGVISVLALIMGLLGFFNWLIWLVLLVGSLYYLRSSLNWLLDIRAIVSEETPQTNAWQKFIRRVVLVMLGLALVMALAPAFSWDGMAYHLVIPQRYIEEGAIRQHLDIHFFGFPQGMEMLYGLLMLLTGASRAPAVLHFYVGVLGLAATFGLIRRHSSLKAAYAALLLLLTSFNYWQLFAWSYVDLALMTYSAIALIAVTEWRKSHYEMARWLALVALACGFAAGVKYTAFPLLLALYLFVVVRNARHFVRNMLIFGGFGVLVFAPWLVKGLLLYENPVYPYIFESVNWDATRAFNFNEADKGLLNSGTIFQAQIPFLPLAATVFGMDKVTPYRFTTGVFLLMLPFALLLGWSRLPDAARKLARDIVPITLVVLAFWMVIAAFSGIGGQTRLMIVAAPMVAILGGVAYHSIEHYPRRPIDMVFILQGALLIALFLGVFDHLHYFAKSRAIEYHIGTISEDTYLETNLGAYYGAIEAMRDLPPESTVQFLWEPKTFYCPAELTCYADLLFDEWARPLQMGLAPEGVLNLWREEGIDYFLFHIQPEGYQFWLGYHGFAQEQNVLFPETFFPAVEEVWTDGGAYTIYRWKEN